MSRREDLTALGWVIRDDDSDLHNYFDQFLEDVCRGTRQVPILPPGEEICMTYIHRFALGAAVVLVTSLPEIERQRQNDLQEKADLALRRRSDSGHEPLRTFRLPESIEEGKVIGRSEYADRPGEYLVRYKAADGRQVEQWFTADAIAADPRVSAETLPEIPSGDDQDHYCGEPVDSVNDAARPECEAIRQASATCNAEWAGTVIRINRYAQDGGLTGSIEIPLI